jgi:hypothetical protein
VSRPARYVAVCAAASVFALVYALDLVAPAIWYAPLAHRWSFTRGDGIAMGWYGEVIAALAIAAAVFVGVAAIARRRPPGPRAVTAASAALIASQVVAVIAIVAR